MSAKVDRIIREIDGLTTDEVQELLRRIRDKLELSGWLKIAESTFIDWNNEEDAVYDNA